MPAIRALGSRLLLWLYAGLLLWLGAIAGLFPTSARLPPPPYADSVVDLPVSGVLLLAALLVLSNQLGLSLPRGAFYVTGLATVGYIPARSVILALAWVAGAAQIAALACGRYAPYRNRSGRV